MTRMIVLERHHPVTIRPLLRDGAHHLGAQDVGLHLKTKTKLVMRFHVEDHVSMVINVYIHTLWHRLLLLPQVHRSVAVRIDQPTVQLQSRLFARGGPQP